MKRNSSCLVMAFCLSVFASGSETLHAAALDDISPGGREFKEAFNQAKGLVRVVLLVSPG